MSPTTRRLPGSWTIFSWLVLLQTNGLVAAWGSQGHERVAFVAEQLLDGYRLTQVRSMAGASLVSLAGYEEEATKALPNLTMINWHRQDPQWRCSRGKASAGGEGWRDNIMCDAKGLEGGSLFCALAWFFKSYSHDALLQAYPPPKARIWSPIDYNIEGAPGVNFTEQVKKTFNQSAGKPLDAAALQQHLFRMTAALFFSKDHSAFARQKFRGLSPETELRFMIMLLGDLHQPLHWLQERRYGADVQIRYKGVEQSLLHFWENELPRAFHALHSQNKMRELYAERSRGWIHHRPDELFRIWAGEMSALACNEVYGPIQMHTPEGGDWQWPNGTWDLPEDIYLRWQERSADLMELAGHRLAFILQDMLQHKRHKRLHKEGQGGYHRHHIGFTKSLRTNCLIGAILVPLLLLLFCLLEMYANKLVRLRQQCVGKSNTQ